MTKINTFEYSLNSILSTDICTVLLVGKSDV